LGLFLVRSALEVAVPFLLGWTIDSLDGHVGRGGGLPPAFTSALVWLGAAYVARNLVVYAVAVASASLGQDLENRLRSELFRCVTRLRFRWHDENRSGKTIARSLRDMEKAKNFFREVAFGYVEMGLLVLGTLIASFATHWTYGVSVGGIVVLAFGVTAWVGARIAKMDRQASDHYDKVTTVLQENVAGARVVRAFGQEPAESEKFGGRLGAFTATWRVLARFWTTVMPAVSHGFSLVVPVALVVGAHRVATGAAPVGEVLAILLYGRTIRDRLRPMTRLVIVGQEAVASAARVFEVIDRDDVLARPKDPGTLPARGGDLSIEDVAFAYPGGRPVLDGVSLHVPPGGSIGILGPTGSGKTTLVHLIPRFYDPQRGRIRLDGIDVARLEPEDLAKAVGLVFQEPFLFSATVAENVAYGNPGLSRERVVECARLAAAHEFVERLPKGYDTVIGERGVSLSGGQRQRLTIARALAMDPRVLIFDDATASVDAVTEKELFDGIRSAARGRTTIVISQRVTSVAWCDRVAVLEDGRLSAVGTHDDLMRESALYREIHRHQTLERVLA
jgi:ATP-binding cassette subfamily B protein